MTGTGGSVVLIRATHSAGFRFGHPHPWGVIRGVVGHNERPCYKVWWPQGMVIDYWPVSDPLDSYDFKIAGDIEGPADAR